MPTSLKRTLLGALAIVIPLAFINGCKEKYSEPLPARVDFNYDIRPILVQKCYLCHGPDPSSRQADLRLDTYEGATALLKDSIRAITPGRPDQSALVFRINHQDPEIVMPPPDSKVTLSEREIALLTKWIEQGVEWKPHWSFIPPKLEEERLLDRETAEGIDILINEKLDHYDLEPSDEADRNTLIRRVSYLLTGLPPTPEAIKEFTLDKSENAYEKVVDSYLNHKGFGERWARHWMDIVRYAETKGHEFDYVIGGAWHYRDYLIRAFNDDLPYDQLVKEHLAGDLLMPARRNPVTGINESHIATAFYAMAEGTHSPVDIRQDEADRIDNMIDVTTKAFQALTVSCARCHDHKFDAIPTTDYYALFGVIESTRFSPVPANITFEEERSIEEIRKLKASMRKLTADRWMENVAPLGDKTVVHPAGSRKNAQKKTPDYTVIGDFRSADLDGWRTDGMAFGEKTTLGTPVFDANKNLILLQEGRASSRIHRMGIFGALRSPNFKIEKDFIGVRALGNKASIRVVIDNFQLISNPIYGNMDQKVNHAEWKNFVFDVSQWKGHKAYVEILSGTYVEHRFSMSQDAFVEVEYAIAYNNEWIDPPLSSSRPVVSLKQAIENWRNHNASPHEIGIINDFLRQGILERQVPGVDPRSLQARLSSHPTDSVAFINAVYDGFGIDSRVFVRGSHRELSEKPVPRRFLSAIQVGDSVFNAEGSGRMQLAESIIDPANPLTARVMVNRIWHHLFGRGIVETVDNFGLQGKLPTHPALLDFLAIRFQEDGWSIKKMVRSIVMTEVFKRSVNHDEIQKGDPDNTWLSHYPVRRLEAEAIRDGLLAVSGRLDTSMYGPPVPLHITSFMQGRGRPKASGPLDGNGRRSIYQEVRRNFLEPMMTTFDRPIPFTAFGKRNVTNVPAQSLILMNNPFVALQAEEMALKLMALKDLTIDERIQWIYLRALSRPASDEELETAIAFVRRLSGIYQIGDEMISQDLRIWKDYCHSVFNLKEFIYLL